MSLGEKIYQLRTAKNLSQEALAEAMDVSRQSISKWETDVSVPELNKLVQLSHFFEISLDELVLGEYVSKEQGDRVEDFLRVDPSVHTESVSSPRKRYFLPSLIFFCAGVILLFLLTLLSGSLMGGLLFGTPFILCAIVCFVSAKSPWLWCIWVFYLLGDLYIRYATGLNWRAVSMTLTFEPWMNPIRLAIAWVMLAITVLMIILTVRELAKRKLPAAFKNLVFVGIVWAVFIAGLLPAAFFPERIYALYFVAIDWAQIVILIAAILGTIGLFRKAKEMAQEERAQQ